ncbi:MAG TPA: alpha-2-macroglobulin family protein [Chloroflexia bacterium]|nr:alpha-2-macroglobulin family protein [Chloroflexia bacterium]
MSQLQFDVKNYSIATGFAGLIRAGSAFAFIAPELEQDDLKDGLKNFFGATLAAGRRIIPFLPEGIAFPGFKVSLADTPLKVAPILVTDKEIYRAGKDVTRLLLVTPASLLNGSAVKTKAKLVLENNGLIYRTQTFTPAEGGMTLVDLGKLPEGNYHVYWDSPEATDYAGDKADCRFSVVEYVLAPLQATLLAHELEKKTLKCRLKVELYNQPLNGSLQVELWSGNRDLGKKKVKANAPGIYTVEFDLKHSDSKRLELWVSYEDLVATVAIPGSSKFEIEETLLSDLAQPVKASLMPTPGARDVRGLYLTTENVIKNAPVRLIDPAPESRKAQIQWQVAAESTHLLLFNMRGEIIENQELGAVSAGQLCEIEVPAPGGFLALGAWIGDKAWEGWSVLLAPTRSKVEIVAPSTARPGQEITLQLKTAAASSIYLLVRDVRLAGTKPQEKLALSLKKAIEGSGKWGKLGFVTDTLNRQLSWNDRYTKNEVVYSMYPPPPPMPMAAPGGIARPMMRMTSAMPTGAPVVNYQISGDEITGEFMPLGAVFEAATAPEARPKPRQDFADVAYCGVLEVGADGLASVKFRLPDAITSYQIEAFALSRDGAEWASGRESLEVSQPVWAEMQLPAFVYPGDRSPATLNLGCAGGIFRLKLSRNGVAVPFNLSGAKQTAAGEFTGHQAKVVFEALPGLWRVELTDLTSGESDVAEREVQAIGRFKGLARRFQLLTGGQTISLESSGALQLRLLPSLNQPFTVLCDATVDYGHRCCEQTAAKLLAAVAALIAGGDQYKLRDVILAGVERESRMFLPGQGFMMYPPEESGGSRTPNDYWGKLAAERLSNLALVGKSLFASNIEDKLRTALETAVRMGEDAARAYKLPLSPVKIESGRDAYRATIRDSKLRTEAVQYARRSLAAATQNVSRGYDAVARREDEAYCAAALLKAGDNSDLKLALDAANRLAASLGSEGRLYSTVDSAALISLMVALQEAGIGTGGQARVRLDGRELPYKEALELSSDGQVREIAVQQGVAVVEVTSEALEDWNSLRLEVPVSIQLQSKGKAINRAMRLGDMLELVVSIPRYEDGLLVQVCLPPALSKIEGGGEVKKFSVDFCGKQEVRIPLRASGYTYASGEHWAVLVRNMFKEEQAGSPGLLLAQVNPD